MHFVLSTGILSIIMVIVASDVTVTDRNGPEIAVIDVHPNSEFLTTAKQMRIHYPGVSTATKEHDVRIKIERILDSSEEFVHEFRVPTKEKVKPREYVFGLKHAKPGDYSAKVCVDHTCSPNSYTLRPIVGQINELTCKKISMQVISVPGSSSDKDIQLKPNPSESSETVRITALPIKQFFSLEDLLKEKDVPPAWSNTYKHFCKQAPCYNYTSHDIYLGYNYDIGHYADLFKNKLYLKDFMTSAQIADLQVGNNLDLTDGYCERKYLLSTIVQLIKSETKEVMYRFKTTLAPNSFIIKKYIFANKPVPVEVMYRQPIDDGLYDVWVAMCLTDKDGYASTICTEALVHEKFRIEDTNLKMKEVKDQITQIQEEINTLEQTKGKDIALKKAQFKEKVLAEYGQMLEKGNWFEQFRGPITKFVRDHFKSEMKKIGSQLNNEFQQAKAGSETQKIVQQIIDEYTKELNAIEGIEDNEEMAKWINNKVEETSQRRLQLEIRKHFLFEDPTEKMDTLKEQIIHLQTKIDQLNKEINNAGTAAPALKLGELKRAQEHEEVLAEIQHMVEKHDWFVQYTGEMTDDLIAKLNSGIADIVKQVIREVSDAKKDSRAQEITKQILEEAKNEQTQIGNISTAEEMEKWVMAIFVDTEKRRYNLEKKIGNEQYLI